MYCFVSLFLVVSTSAIDCLESLVSKMTYYLSSGMLNPTQSFTIVLLSFVSASDSTDRVCITFIFCGIKHSLATRRLSFLFFGIIHIFSGVITQLAHYLEHWYKGFVEHVLLRLK